MNNTAVGKNITEKRTREKPNRARELTEGPLIKGILLFALPILVGNVFQQLYNVADTAIIGHILGDNALAAVGATTPIYNLVIGFANGLTNGFAIILARHFGSKHEKNIRKASAKTVEMSLLVALLLTVISLLGLRPLLCLLNTPAKIIKASASYLQIILGFSTITILYNMFAAMLRAIGNSLAPLVFLIISTLTNIGLDFLFVGPLGLGIKGAAYATVLAQLLSAILCLIYVIKKCPALYFGKDELKFDFRFSLNLLTMGLSNGLMLAVVSVGSVILQSAVNSFGPETIAAHSAARKIDDLFMQPISSICLTAATFTSQNLGANNPTRIKKGIRSMLLICFAWCGFAFLIIYTCAVPMIHALTGSSDAIILSTAKQYTQINIVFFAFLSVLCVIRSSLQGLGQKIVPLIASSMEFLLNLDHLYVHCGNPFSACGQKTIAVPLIFRIFLRQLPAYSLLCCFVA